MQKDYFINMKFYGKFYKVNFTKGARSSNKWSSLPRANDMLLCSVLCENKGHDPETQAAV